MIVFLRTIFAAVLFPIFVSGFISFTSLSAFAQVVQQTPQVAPDKPAESAPISPSVALPTIEKIGASKVEPPAAANSTLVITPAQEAAEILASGKFLAPLIPEGGFLVRASGTLGRDEFLVFGHSNWTVESMALLIDHSFFCLPSLSPT